ncbi:MAG TPA: nucleotide exchange factor GrpE [Balneolaceae bacterium]|nr:nucleotide exchange factor GrpE [Balneolaceae bacterium]
MKNKSEEKTNINPEAQSDEQEKEQNEETLYQEHEEDELIALLKEKDDQIEDLEVKTDDLKNTVLRKAAELDNYRKRVQRERSQIYNSAKANALEDFLSISDDLTRTLDATKESEVPESFLEGVTLLADKFNEVLKKHGVKRIDEVMVPFDVDLHDAMMRQKPEDKSVESDMVLKVIENGYKIDDRVIRHAKVIVSE